jgi:hypothetical protein
MCQGVFYYGIGLYCGILDSEGNRVSMLQPSPWM